MKIDPTMDLSQLPEFPRGSFVPEQLVLLVELLNRTAYQNTADVPPQLWRQMIESTRIRCLLA